MKRNTIDLFFKPQPKKTNINMEYEDVSKRKYLTSYKYKLFRF